MNEEEKFDLEVQSSIDKMSRDSALQEFSNKLMREIVRYKYSYFFRWLGRPIIQLPQDIIATQEIIWKVKPTLIIETGIAHGGGLIFYASILELIGGEGQVIGIDIDIRSHNRRAIEEHPLSKRITILEGSSTDPKVVQKVYETAQRKKPIMVILDSLHTHEHVLKELQYYSPLVTKGSYLIVLDTAIEDLPDDLWKDRPWSKGNNPKTAVLEFLRTNDRFVIDKEISNKLLITSAPDGYLKCIKD
ncbi:MAG: cephalosporin hydroxylase family protein [Nitrososphaerota archaeon]